MPLEPCYLDNEDGTHVLQIKGGGGDAPTVLGPVKSRTLYFTTSSGSSYSLGQVYIGASQDSLTEFYADQSDAHIDLPDELVGVSPLYFAQGDNGATATVVNELASSTPSSPGYSVGDTVTYGGIECVIAYDAGSEQSWGRYILCEKWDLNHYETGLGTGGTNQNYSGKQWGFYGFSTVGVTDTAIGTGKDNTDQLISKNNNSTDTLWYYARKCKNKLDLYCSSRYCLLYCILLII